MVDILEKIKELESQLAALKADVSKKPDDEFYPGQLVEFSEDGKSWHVGLYNSKKGNLYLPKENSSCDCLTCSVYPWKTRPGWKHCRPCSKLPWRKNPGYQPCKDDDYVLVICENGFRMYDLSSEFIWENGIVRSGKIIAYMIITPPNELFNNDNNVKI
jgi:hypothetical protein